MTDPRRYAPATQRNQQAIAQVLTQILPPQGTILEIASGTGEHAIYFAPQVAPRRWIPSDKDPENLASVTAWQAHAPSPNLASPVALDVTQSPWPVEIPPLPDPPITALVAINLIHISPWEATLALFAGAQRILSTGGVIYLYGPYRQQAVVTAPSNEAFDQSLKARNPQWGLRSLEAVVAVAADHGFTFTQAIAMPANNLSVVFSR